MKRPVVTVSCADEHQFEMKCEALVGNGYIMHSSSCGFVNSEAYDLVAEWHAIFVLRGSEWKAT